MLSQGASPRQEVREVVVEQVEEHLEAVVEVALEAAEEAVLVVAVEEVLEEVEDLALVDVEEVLHVVPREVVSEVEVDSIRPPTGQLENCTLYYFSGFPCHLLASFLRSSVLLPWHSQNLKFYGVEGCVSVMSSFFSSSIKCQDFYRLNLLRVLLNIIESYHVP